MVSPGLSLDITTLVVVAVTVSALLGMLLLFASLQERMKALAWWGTAYLLGGISVGAWMIEDFLPFPAGTVNVLLFLACGMIWSAARLFHGRDIRWGAQSAGAAVWLVLCFLPIFAQWHSGRVILSALIISAYTFLTAAELWRERRRSLIRRWPALFVPILHGAIFLFPIPLAAILPDDGGMMSLATGWVAIFALELMLYAIGTAFLVLVLANERMVRVHKDAANTDGLTRLLNRQGFRAGADQLVARCQKGNHSVAVLMFDLDHFKSINDRFGHAVGDEALRVFASSISKTLRAGDLIGRLGGEEFAAMLPVSEADALIVAERVRANFESIGKTISGHAIGATVSIGVAVAPAGEADLDRMLAQADAALYRAKAKGRNRIEAGAADEPAETLEPVPLALAS